MPPWRGSPLLLPLLLEGMEEDERGICKEKKKLYTKKGRRDAEGERVGRRKLRRFRFHFLSLSHFLRFFFSLG